MSLAAKRSNLAGIAAAAHAWRAAGERVVLVAGVFDPMLAAHARQLAAWRADQDRLVVGVLGDRSAAAAAARTLLDEEHRATLVAALSVVDRVVVFEREAWPELIAALEPRAAWCASVVLAPDAEAWPAALEREEQALVERVLAGAASR